MHSSSRLKVECFLKVYGDQMPNVDGKTRVLEVGSKAFDAQDTYRPLFESDKYEYTGLDVESGPNVDIVPAKGYVWEEIANDSFDVCISGQTFEHNPFFWVTFAEMSRVVVPNGYLLVTAPGSGEIHRYPYDCWRFYPDSWLALCSMTGMKLVESYFESDATARVVPGGNWHDSTLIAQKPEMTETERRQFDERIRLLTAAYKDLDLSVGTPVKGVGPCFGEYEKLVQSRFRVRPLREFRRRLRGKAPQPLQKGKSFHGS